MKKISYIILLIALLGISYYYFGVLNDNRTDNIAVNTITLCDNTYKVNADMLGNKNILTDISNVVNYNYKNDNYTKPTGDNPTEYIKYSVRPFAIASSTCSALAKSYDDKQLNIHDVKKTAESVSFYINNIVFYYYPNNKKSILINLYPEDQSGMSGPNSLEIK